MVVAVGVVLKLAELEVMAARAVVVMDRLVLDRQMVLLIPGAVVVAAEMVLALADLVGPVLLLLLIVVVNNLQEVL
jgi:hypothetical protein